MRFFVTWRSQVLPTSVAAGVLQARIAFIEASSSVLVYSCPLPVPNPTLAAEVAAVEGHADVVAGRRLPVRRLALHEQVCAGTIGSRHGCLLVQEQGSGERSVGLVVDGDGERRGLDRRRTGHRLDRCTGHRRCRYCYNNFDFR